MATPSTDARSSLIGSQYPPREGISSELQTSFAITQPTPASTARLLPPMDGPSKSSLMDEHRPNHLMTEEFTSRERGCTIDTLPDEVLLVIFDYYVCKRRWQTLVHVCRRWRAIVFAAPRRLELRLVCKANTPVRKTLDIWPALPIVIKVANFRGRSVDNVVAALENNDRVCRVSVGITENNRLEILAKAMKNPFPALTDLDLRAYGDGPIFLDHRPLPDSFLGGFAPRLRSLHLNCIGFPALPKLLLSATGLVSLRLENIPSCGYVPPEAMVGCLRLMPRLECLQIEFKSAQSHPYREHRHPLPPIRTVLPELTMLYFKGEREYLFCLFAHIDAPLLEVVNITFFGWAAFDVSQIWPFIGRTESFEAFDQVHMQFTSNIWRLIRIALSSRSGATSGRTLVLSFTRSDSFWSLTCLTHCQAHHLFSPPLADLKPLDIERRDPPHWYYWTVTGNAEWLALFRLFSAVRNLYISEEVAVYVAPALEELEGERVMEVLPALRTLFIQRLDPSGPVQKAIGWFASARELSGHPVAVQRWEE